MTESGWIKILPSTGIVPGPGMGYGCTALTRLLQARESNPDAAKEEKPRVRLFEELLTDVRRSIKNKRWAAERLEQATRSHPTEVPPEAKERPPTPKGEGVGERRYIELADSGRSESRVTEQYIFRQRGEFWEIAYGGEPFHLQDIKGLHYVALLLQNPNREFDVMEMVRIVEKNTSGVDINLQAEESLDGVTDLDDDYEKLDPQAMAEYRNRLREIREEREQATECDNEKSQALDDEVEQIERELHAATGLGGRSRSFPTSHEDARSSVRQAIRSVFDKAGAQPLALSLSEYLQSTIKTGDRCSYRPDPDMAITWEM